MKQKKSSIKAAVLGCAFFLAGLSAAYASMSCDGTVYFKKPASWTSAFAVAGGQKAVFTNSPHAGWLQVSASAIGGANAAPEFFLEQTGANDCNSGKCARRDSMNIMYMAYKAGLGFKCTDFGATGELWISEYPDPSNPNSSTVTFFSSAAPDAKFIYFLVPPEDIEWMSSVPMISTDGGVTGKPMTADPDRCGWYYHVWVSDLPTEQVIFYRDDDVTKKDAIGLNGLWDEDYVADPIPMGTYFALYATNKLYFIPDDSYWPDDGASLGWYDTDPITVEGSCSYSLAAIIYDTDATLHPAFSCYSGGGEGCQQGAGGIPQAAAVAAVNACLGVTPGIVEDLLGPDNKPVLKAGQGISCFHTPALFNQLFNETPGVNEMTCFDLPFSRANDGRWEFDSDKFTAPNVQQKGGFYPVENTTNADIISANPTSGARETRPAEGPVRVTAPYKVLDPVEGIEAIDLLCNGPGWTGGTNCAKQFEGDIPAVWEWDKGPDGTPRWNGVKRNQHFCFESHASFTHKPGLRFNFRGDDDIWVYIGGKLAVDLGGTHLAAPAYVNLDLITDKNGLPLLVGETYAIDIFFCDRRTTMSNVRIKTNMYIQQTTGLAYKVIPNPDDKIYRLCWKETGDGSCAAALGGAKNSVEYCGDSIITEAGKSIDYMLYRVNGSIVPGGSVADFATGTLFFGGIDLTNRGQVAISPEKMQGLSPGRYQLFITIGNKTVNIKFTVSGSLDVVTRDAIDPDDKAKTWKFMDAAMAGVKIPVYVSSISDPGTGALELDIEGAFGQAYSVTTSPGLNLYASEDSDVILTPADFPRTIGEGGVDTLWATIPLAVMLASSELHTVQVTGRPSVANLTFFAPRIIFMDEVGTQITDLKDTMWVGSLYNARLVAINPATNTICTDCNFTVTSGSATSPKVEIIPAVVSVVNGEAVITLRSLKDYMITPATLAVIGPNAVLLNATLTPLFFKDPPVPFPVLAEIFDKHGAVSDRTLAIPPPYFSTGQEYLDGIADSLTIQYHRKFHPDSLPDSIFVKWDLGATTGGILDSIKINKAQIIAGASCTGNVCDSIISIHGLTFSKDIQTKGSPNTAISSWATYMDKTLPVPLSSQVVITDRIAPILLKGRVSNVKDNSIFDRVILLASEPILIKEVSSQVSNGRSAFSYYLQSATELGTSPDAKYINVAASSGVLDAARDTVVMLYDNSNNLVPSPRAGDFVRFRADIPLLISDVEGNFPTNYTATVPSPWAAIEGDAKTEVLTITVTGLDPNSDKVKQDMRDQKIVELIHVGIYDSKDSVLKANPGTLGHIIKTDMGNILTSAEYADVDPKDVYMEIETQYFTNLGSFVADYSYKLYCTDKFFEGDCRTHPSYVYVAWNLLSKDSRMVGTGAYISKLSTSVNIAGHGKTAKHELTEMWGVKRGGRTGNIFK